MVKNLASADVAVDKAIEVPAAPAWTKPAEDPKWLVEFLAEVPAAVAPEAPSEEVAPVAEEKPEEKAAVIPLQPSEADQSVVAQQLKDRGRGMMDRRAALGLRKELI